MEKYFEAWESYIINAEVLNKEKLKIKWKYFQ
jgi:hypothetical protein